MNSHELRAGDTIYLQTGEIAKITRIEQRYEPYLPVANLTVRQFHTFFVGAASVLVHNTSWCELYKEVVEEFKGVANVTELMIRRRMAEKAYPPGGDWSTFIGKTHTTDALGRTKAQADAIEMPDIHGHHIKFKKAQNEADVEVQDILLEYDIDPMFGKEMLVFAPNKGHPRDINLEVGDSIKRIAVESKNAKRSKEDTRKLLIEDLQRQAENYIESRWPGYLQKHGVLK